ncbi:MAG: sigma-70 family RNA polymerase sigma factor [bacterium]|nr:sigma-70 family RNA polymerase sigma factor [bacterium]
MKNYRDKADQLLKKGRNEHQDSCLPHAAEEMLDADYDDLPHLEDIMDSLNSQPIDIQEDEEIEPEIEGKKHGIRKGKRYVSDSPIKAYFKEINHIPLLSADEEKELAIEMEKKKIKIKEIELKIGMSAKRFRKWNEEWGKLAEGVPPTEGLPQLAEFSAEEIQDMLSQLNTFEAEIEKIKTRFIEANLRLVVTFAKKYVPGGVMSLLDIINEGNLGLIKSVERYNYMEGYRFSTYAIWWIKQSILRAVSDKARTIRIPIYMVEIINRCLRTIQTLAQQLGREPELEEIAEKMNLPVPKVIELINIAQDPISLDSPMGIDGESQLGDLIEDKETLSPAKTLFLRMLQERISDILNMLPEKEKMTLKLRFGLDGMEPHTLEEVGKILGLTRERARQIEKNVLEKLRNMKITWELQSFLRE